MANGRGLFSELFGYVLLFEQTHQQGDYQPDYEQVRRGLNTLIEQERAMAKRQGMLDRDFQDACFAVVAWADETILKHTSWKHHPQWNAQPLQVEHFQTRNAGEEFFVRLQQLRPEPKAVREVYYQCLGLGFSGQYFLGLEDDLKLNHIRHEQAQHLALPLTDVEDLDKLTPQPYQVPTEDSAPIKRPWTDQLLKLGLPLLILIPIVLALVYWFWLTPTQGPVVPLAERVQQWLDSHASLLECAKITGVDVESPRISLNGRVSSEAQAMKIRQGLQSLQRGLRVEDTFQTIPRPFCEVLDLLEPFQKRNEEQGFGLAAALNKAGEPPLYVGNENFMVEIKTPAKYESYIYVDYYSTDETVGHLFPNDIEKGNRFGLSRTYTVGQLNGLHAWVITPPFGRDLVTVIASKTPLFAEPRPAGEPAVDYLKELRRALPKDLATSEMAATFSFLQTQERP